MGPRCFGCSSGYSWLEGCEGTVLAHVHLPVPPGPFQQGCAPSFHPPACTDSRGCHHPGARPCTWICLNLMKFSWTYYLSLSRSLWMATHPTGVSTTPHTLVPSNNLLKVHLIPLSVSLMRMLKSTGPHTDPLSPIYIQTPRH